MGRPRRLPRRLWRRIWRSNRDAEGVGNESVVKEGTSGDNQESEGDKCALTTTGVDSLGRWGEMLDIVNSGHITGAYRSGSDCKV